MTPSENKAAADAYYAYVDAFRDASGALLDMQQLKLEHSCRVAEIAKFIAADEHWRDDEITLAETVGLYHDIGRYTQFRDFRTFQDQHSINHGERGYEVIKNSAMLNFLAPEQQEIIETATRFHNAKLVADGLPAVVERFLRLDRDGDKIDIYHVLVDNIERRVHEKYPEILHGASPDAPASDALVDRVLSGEIIGYGEAKSLSDFLVVGLQWLLNSFNFVGSYRLLRDRDVVGKIASVIKLSPKVEQLLATSRACVESKISAADNNPK